MSWIPVLATALGAVIALGSAVLTEHLRSGRERNDKAMTARREAYAGYLSALHDANEALRSVSLNEHAPELTRTQAARTAFRTAGVTRAREHIILIAPPAVITAADRTFRSLRAIRDRIGQGEGPARYEPELQTYAQFLHALRTAIRNDLGVNEDTPEIPL